MPYKKAPNQLANGQKLTEGKSIRSPNGRHMLRLRKGTLELLYNGKVRWSPPGSGVVSAVMQGDGNFVTYRTLNPKSKADAIWSSGTSYRGTWLELQDDGNLVLFDYGGSPKWDPFNGKETGSGGILSVVASVATGPTKWLANAASVAGRSLTHVVADGIKSAGGLVGKIPIIGGPLHSVINIATGPFLAIDAIVHGARIDKALVSAVKDEISAIREVGPYAKLLVTAIPGLGSGVSAALAFSTAVVGGMPLNKAFVEATIAAIPYGALAKTLVDYTQKVIAGENVIKASVNAGLAQLPKEAREGLDLVQRAAKGENIPKLALEKARALLPDEAQKGFDIGIAIGQGKKLQNVVAEGIQKMGAAELEKFAGRGQDVISKTPIFTTAISLAKSAQEQQGFKVGAAVLGYAGVNETSITQFRGKLTQQAQVGFDLAVSARIGKVVSKPPPKGLSPKAQVGYYMTHGMVGGGKNQKTAMMKVVAADKDARVGAALALEAHEGWFRKILKAVGLA